ncbi:MAG: hypothetical protein WAM11_16245 [Cyanobium sp.]
MVAAAVEQPAASLMPPPPQLPVMDLIGLRFSLHHLRLVGYGLLAAWLAELINLLSSPGLLEIAARLQSISQLLDLSPILLVGISLVAFQGGLRRSWLEMAALPLLLALLPLLSAFHFFLAPVSVANVVTLVQKQQQIGRDQLQRIDRQMDRATQILAESDSIDALLAGLQRIPGLQVRVPPHAAVAEARQQVRGTLNKERDRIQERIKTNLANSRQAFVRRAAINAGLALLIGLLLWGLHHGAMAEMNQSIPYLQWVQAGAASVDNPQALVQLIEFQRACAALGWFAMLERSLRLARRLLGMAPVVEPVQDQEPLPPEFVAHARAGARPGFSPGSLQAGSPLHRLQSWLPFQTPLLPVLVPPAGEVGWTEADDQAEQSASSEEEAWLRMQQLQQERDLRRYRRQVSRVGELDELHELWEDNEALLRELDELRSQESPAPRGMQRLLGPFWRPDSASRLPTSTPRNPSLQLQLRLQQQDLERYRRQAGRLDQSEMLQALLEGNEELLPELDDLRSLPPPRPRGLRRLGHWFITHL